MMDAQELAAIKTRHEERTYPPDIQPAASDDMESLLAEVERLRGQVVGVQPVLVQAESILSLLHHRGIVDSPMNREDVEAAVVSLRRALEVLDGRRAAIAEPEGGE